MGRFQDKFPGEGESLRARIFSLVCALRDLVKECEDADHWIRHTESFERAKLILKDEDKTG